LNWSINQCAQTTNTKPSSRPDAGIRIHSPYAPRAPDNAPLFTKNAHNCTLAVHTDKSIATSAYLKTALIVEQCWEA
ncbi:MAG: hypothetical protein NC248_08685, partial [Bacteroides sp.]|nr:hypothetical protein [Bacteroides sp.]